MSDKVVLCEKRRIQWIDLAKGIGVFLVLFSHMPSIPWPIRGWIESFHMPLFFFLSGYVHKVRDDESSIMFIKKRVRTLLLPFFTYSLLFLIGDLLFGEKEMHQVGEELYKIIIGLGTVDILWFFVSLFIVEVLFFFICRIEMLRKYIIVFTGVIFMVGWSLSQVIPGDVAFKIPTTIIALSYYAEGFICKNKQSIRFSWYTLIGAGILSLTVTGFALFKYGSVMNMYYGSYSNPIVVVVASAAGIMLLLQCCLIVEHWKIVAPLCYIGKNTLYYYPLMGYLPGVIMTTTEILGYASTGVFKIMSKVVALGITTMIVRVKHYRQERKAKV